MYEGKTILTSEDIRITTPAFAMKRYYDVVVLKIVGLDKINEALELIQIQHKKYQEIKQLLPQRCKYEKSHGIELIQLTNTLDLQGNVVGLFTVGTIDSAYLNNITKTLYQIEH